MNGARFVRFYPSDWRSGCIGLSLEQEGLYVRICAFVWETGRRIPLDDIQGAHILGLNPKNYRRVRNELLTLGKITAHEDGYGNDRAEAELAAARGAGSVTEARRRDAGKPSAAAQKGPRRAADPGQERSAGTHPIADQSAINPESIADQSPIMSQKTQQNQYPSIEPIANSLYTPLTPMGAEAISYQSRWRRGVPPKGSRLTAALSQRDAQQQSEELDHAT